MPNSTVRPLFHGTPVLISKRQIYREKQIDALKKLTKLMELVIEQEKKYGERLLSHINFYYLMVQLGIEYYSNLGMKLVSYYSKILVKSIKKSIFELYNLSC